jgi:hypothetical protein
LVQQENSDLQGQQLDKQEEEGFYSAESFPPLHVTRLEVCMGHARFSIRINQINQINFRVTVESLPFH